MHFGNNVAMVPLDSAGLLTYYFWKSSQDNSFCMQPNNYGEIMRLRCKEVIYALQDIRSW